MQLWNDYEGVTIDGAFPLHKLLLPEGRSAFFSTAGPKGEPTVVRLIECHFDEEEILARWGSMAALNHPNFLKFEHYGQVQMDDGPVVYVVVERVDANLAEVLEQGRLSVKDVAQLALSLVSALDVLHTHGFIHEHVETRNIFAVGEVVKLRSDCIREAPENGEGQAAKARDVRDLVLVLLEALTQQRSVEALSDGAVTSVFRQVIRNGMDGSWGLAEIQRALEGAYGPVAGSGPAAKSAPEPRLEARTEVVAEPASGADLTPATAKAVGTVSAGSSVAEQKPEEVEVEASKQLPLPLEDADWESTRAGARRSAWGDEQSSSRFSGLAGVSMRSRWIGVAAIVAVLMLLCTWGFVHAWNAHPHASVPASGAPTVGAGTPAAAPAGSGSASAPAATERRVSALPAASSHAGWRVIAFTYNRKADAEKKAASLAHGHPELRPTVFAPSGRAPYLVSVGGVMDRDAAFAFARRARSLGLPRDIYAQNYSR